MDKLRAINLLVRLADLGSFTAVADEHGLSKSMVSKEISRLEEDLGVRLIHRSTRSVQLTQLGEGYVAQCREVLQRLRDAESFVQDLQTRPRGKLRINVPMALGLTDMSHMFAEFMKAYPEIELDIHLGDEFVDLVEQGFDLGFRAVSTPFESNYIGRVLTRFSYRICASPEYIEQHDAILSPADLQHHNCFVYSYFPTRNLWPVAEGVRVQGTLRVNNTLFMLEAIKHGNGIGFLPEFVCNDAIRNNEVVEILADSEKPQLTLYALYPARDFVQPKLLACIGFLQHWFARHPLPGQHP